MIHSLLVKPLVICPNSSSEALLTISNSVLLLTDFRWAFYNSASHFKIQSPSPWSINCWYWYNANCTARASNGRLSCHMYELKKMEINQQTREIIETNQTSIDNLLIHYWWMTIGLKILLEPIVFHMYFSLYVLCNMELSLVSPRGTQNGSALWHQCSVNFWNNYGKKKKKKY